MRYTIATTTKRSAIMTYITCSHPSGKLTVKTEVEQAIDMIRSTVTPRPFCEACESYLPVFESPGRQLLNWWFVRQDGKVRAVATT